MKTLSHQTIGDNVFPINYNLTFEPDLKSFKTKVHEKISCHATHPTNRITLNAKEMKVESAFVVFGYRISQAKIKLDQKNECVYLQLPVQVSGDFEIELNATCTNNDGMYGFYRSKYEYKGKTNYLLTSQFEAANARAAFVCFDEPLFKATFEVSFKIPKELDAISNMPLKETKILDKETKQVSFARTLKMSSYLLYLFVGNYEYVEDRLGNLKIRVITVPGKKDLARLPLVYSKKFISHLQKYFGIDFPLPKIDFIAIPDFAAGAMENWGAITFRETALLFNEKTSVSLRQQISMVIAHELVHQWFGDLVTMEWWDDLWLNESFAEFMSAKAVDSVFPAWDYMVQYVDDTLGTAFSADSLLSTHPISVHVNTPAQIDAIFDEISYEKGGSVLYMLENYVGKEVFRKGLNLYLTSHSYANARKEHLWLSIQKAATMAGKKLDVSGLMSKWVTKKGHPIVSVEKIGHGFLLSQERYTISKRIKDTWPIPISYKSANGTGQILMSKRSLALKDNSGWIKLNYGQKGLYRVAYTRQLTQVLGALIKAKRIGMLDAWGIENDIFAKVSSGRAQIEEYLEFVDNYCTDVSYPLSQNISGHLGFLFKMCYKTNKQELTRCSLIKFNKTLLAKLGWQTKKGEREIDTITRGSVIMRLGIAGDNNTLKKSGRLFDSYIKKQKEIDSNIRAPIYVLGAWQGDEKLYLKFIDKFKKEKMADEQRRFLYAISSFRDKALISKALEFSKSKFVRLQDSFMVPALIAGNIEAYDFVWKFTKANWKYFMGRYEPGTHMLSRYVGNLSMIKDQKTLSDIKRFFANKSNLRDDMRPALLHSLERIEANIKFMRKNDLL